ncbi:MAG: translation initiation factor IF-5A [Candidatus Nezhaarchaeota archaeon]|nr:translation initiation factor IF-5A [Candidatus Nezhaarchaeota archaeon]MCX8141944.1 translation initiation factor IF-5A [Candidatus Nezhaarchaeota archaeon]MDW8050275.1 translation initiation factor IF-5A [Nitrososphaerota archaeon]
MSRRPVDAGTLKEGSFIVIDNEACRIVEVEKSKPGKHGSAKVRITAMGIFDGVKRSIVVPVDQKVDVPVVEKKIAQVIAITPSTIQLMDLSSYEVYEVAKEGIEPEVAKKISVGTEVEIWEILGKKKIMRTR